MGTEAINILQVTNAGTTELEINFFPANSASIGMVLPVKASSSLFTIPVGVAGNRLRFTVHLQNASQPARLAELYFEEQDGMNQFFVDTYRGGQLITTPVQSSPITPGKNISLSVNYDGDGVVIVGTGEL